MQINDIILALAGSTYLSVVALGASAMIRNRSKMLDLDESTKEKIQSEGIYHVTTKENAQKIIESGFLVPTSTITGNHFSKSRYGDGFGKFVYMFAGKPSGKQYEANLAHKAADKDGTIYAVKFKPDKFEMNNFTERLEDGTITYEDRLVFANTKPEIVRLMYEKGEMKEIPLDMELAQKPKIVRNLRRIKQVGASLKQTFMKFYDNLHVVNRK